MEYRTERRIDLEYRDRGAAPFSIGQEHTHSERFSQLGNGPSQATSSDNAQRCASELVDRKIEIAELAGGFPAS